MDYKTFLNKVGETSGENTASVEEFIGAFTTLLEESLRENDTVCIPGFGNFEAKKRNERIMTHPSDPTKRMLVPPKVVVNFKPSVILKTKINES